MPPTSGAAAALTQFPSLHGRGASPSPTTNDVLSVHYLGKIVTVAVDKIPAKKQRHVSTSEGAAPYEPTAADLCAEVIGSTSLSPSETVLRCDGQCLRGDFLLTDIPVNAKLEVQSTSASLMSTFTTKLSLPTSSRKRSRSLEDDDPTSASTTTVVLPVVVGNVAQWLGPSAATEKSHRWTVYLRGVHNEDLSPVVESVSFLLHETFPNHIRTVSRPPFEVTEHGWGEFLIGLSVKIVGVPVPVDVTHMLQFSLRPRPPHSIPPHGRPMEKDESTPYTLSPQPCVHEWYDEFVVPNAPEVLQAKHASMVQSLAAVAAASSTNSLAAHRAVMVGGVSCWDDIRKHGSRYLVGTAAHPPPAPPSDDEMILSSLKMQLRAAIAQLRADVAPSLLSSLRLKPTS